jgi:hypothetical protein
VSLRALGREDAFPAGDLAQVPQFEFETSFPQVW